MEIEYINITSYAGISSEAEHFYAKYHTPQSDDFGAFIDGEKPYTFDADLKYYPDRRYAEDLCRKDNRMLYGAQNRNVTDVQTEKMMVDGTLRFPSILEVIRTARKKFPGAVLCLYLHGVHRAFAEYLNRLNEIRPKDVEDIIALLKDIKTRQEPC